MSILPRTYATVPCFLDSEASCRGRSGALLGVLRGDGPVWRQAFVGLVGAPPGVRLCCGPDDTVRCVGHCSALHRSSQRAASGLAAHCVRQAVRLWCRSSWLRWGCRGRLPASLGLLHRPPCRCSLLRSDGKRECARTLLYVSWRTRGTWSIPAGAGQKGRTGVLRCRGGGPGVPLRVPYCLSSRITQLSYSPLRLISMPRFMRNLPVKV